MSSSIQFWGLGSGMSNIGDVVDALLLEDKLKLQGYSDKTKVINNKKSAWTDMKSTLEKLNTSIKDLSGVNKQNFKAAKVSTEGFFTASIDKTTANMDYSISVSQLAQKHTVAGVRVGSINEPLKMAGSFKVNGAQIDISDEDSLSDIMKKINSAKNADGKSIGAKAHIIDGVLFIESEKTGVSNSVQLEDTSGLLNKLGLVKDDGSVNTTKEAKNALLSVNGIQIERESNNIDDVIDGVTLNLNKVTTEDIQLSVANDKEQVKGMVKTFVDTINELYSKISKYSSYDSAAGTAGLLNGDASVMTVKNTLANALQGKFGEGEFGYLFDLGITTDRYGKLQLDESKLDAALDSNIDDVVAMFTKGLDNPKSEANESNGIFVRVKDALNKLIGGTENIFKSKFDSFDAQVKNYEKMSERQQSYIEKRQKMLEAQFRAMEQTMNSINSQSGMLSNMSSLNSSNKE